MQLTLPSTKAFKMLFVVNMFIIFQTPQKSATSYPSKVPMGKTTAIAKPVKSQEEPAQSRAGQIVGKERLSQPELPSQKRSDEFKRVIARQDDSVDVSHQCSVVASFSVYTLDTLN